MDAAIEAKIKKLEESKYFDPASAETLASKAQEWKETCPGDALRIFRFLAIQTDRFRFHTASEKLHFYSEAAELGWSLNDSKSHFDGRAAELHRDAGNAAMAGFHFQRAAKAVSTESVAEGCDRSNDWILRSEYLREARAAFHSAGRGDEASQCFVAQMKLARDNAKNWPRKARGWASYVFWSWGESPTKVAFWGAVWIIFFAIGYAFTGMNVPGGVEYHFGKAVYLSAITFTTLGYGDVTPATWLGKVLAATEALSGIFFTGLFLVTFVKRFTR